LNCNLNYFIGIALLHTLIGNSAIVRNPQSDAGDMENQNELSSKNAHLEKAMENENRRINKKFALLDLRHLHTLVENSATTVGNGRNELSSSLVHLEKAMENENRRIHQKYALLDLRHFYEQRDNFLLRNIFNEIVQLTKGINIEVLFYLNIINFLPIFIRNVLSIGIILIC
jgi:hypothetical protein